MTQKYICLSGIVIIIMRTATLKQTVAEIKPKFSVLV